MIAVFKNYWSTPLRRHDIFLIGIMGVLAGCGLIYEYLMAHFAGRILGSVESTIFAMIGIMIVSMGMGSFYSRTIKCPFTGFAWIEVVIGLLGGLAVLIMAGVFAIAHTLPVMIREIYGIDTSISIDGGWIDTLKHIAEAVPFFIGFTLGFLVGMEIPLIARIREQLHEKHLVHNTGTIYGADYIGAGIGAAIWVLVCLKIPIMEAAVATAAVNTLMGFCFLYRYRKHINNTLGLWVIHGVLACILVILFYNGQQWMRGLNNTLFQDQVAYSKKTHFQYLTITERHLSARHPKVYSLYINGRLQFASNDEGIYHSMLTYPALLTSAKTNHVLVVGGGDGMAVRDILRWNPQSITLADLDGGMLALFKGEDTEAPKAISDKLLELNEGALLDERVTIIQGDAFKTVEQLVEDGKLYDTIIVDLPDPSHPDLNKLYSDYFYGKLKELLNGDGVVAIQSTSPFHAKKAFLSIGKTLAASGFNTEQYHTNVPSFGEWGWTIGTKMGGSVTRRLAELDSLPVANEFISMPVINASFVFHPAFYSEIDTIDVNIMGSHATYQYHLSGWETGKGVFFNK
ncbi:MAG: spermidine synthase [Flavobacteriales bacterium]|jgi:spermidine synthase